MDPVHQTIERLRTVEELARIAGLSPAKVRADIRVGALSALKVGQREYRITERAARHYLRHDDKQIRQLERGTVLCRLGPFVDVREFADACQASLQHVRNMIRSGLLPGFGLGTTKRARRYLLQQDALAFLFSGNDDSPWIHDWAEVYFKALQRRTRPVEPDTRDLIRVLLRFWGKRPDGRSAFLPIVENAPYHDLRLTDPVREPDWVTRFASWLVASDFRERAITSRCWLVARGMWAYAAVPAWQVRTGVFVNPFSGRSPSASRKQTDKRAAPPPDSA